MVRLKSWLYCFYELNLGYKILSNFIFFRQEIYQTLKVLNIINKESVKRKSEFGHKNNKIFLQHFINQIVSDDIFVLKQPKNPSFKHKFFMRHDFPEKYEKQFILII